VIENGVTPALLDATTSFGDTPQAIYAARLIELKRPLLLIEAWSVVVAQIPAARLIVFGDGPMAGTTRERARALGVESSIDFRGFAPQADVWRAMRAGWVTVLPSRDEGLSVLLLESLAAGVPFVSAECMREIAEQTGGGVALPEPVSREALANALIEQLGDREAARARGTRGRERVLEVYGWPAIAERKAEIYRVASQQAQARP
jgi:glycosyltransferase involved in cell wall biosynthesis